MEMNSSVHKTFDLTYTIDDLSLDIQEIIDNELKKDNNDNDKNAWLCDSCGVLNKSDKQNCECGQERNNYTQDESSSESSFEIINKDGSVQETSSLKTNEQIKDVKFISFLCSTCGTVSNNNKCSCDRNNRSLEKTDTWECAWCNVENQTSYFKCKDCGHLRLDITKTANENISITLPVEKNCWDPRQWSLTNNLTDNQLNSSVSLFPNEKSESENINRKETKWWKLQPTCQNESEMCKIGTHKIQIATSKDTASIFNETTTDLKTDNVQYKFANKTTADETDNQNLTHVLVPNNLTNDVNANLIIYKQESTDLRDDKQVKTTNLLVDYPQVSENLVSVHHGNFITLNMLQEALKSVNNNKSATDKGGTENSETECAKLKYRINVCTQTDVEKNNGNKTMTDIQEAEVKKSTFKPFRDFHEPENWKCRKCKLLNPHTLNNCVVCHGSKQTINKDIENKIQDKNNLPKSSEQIKINDKSTQISNNDTQLDEFSLFAYSITDDKNSTLKSENIQNKEAKKSPKSNQNVPNDMLLEEQETKNNTEAFPIVLSDIDNKKKKLRNEKESLHPIDELITFSEDIVSNESLWDGINFDIECTWTCPSCKLINSGSTNKCSACRSDCLLDTTNFDTIEPFNNFSEQQVTDLVDIEKLQIKEKVEVQTKDLTSLIDDINNWRCNICTFLNPSTLTNCRICHNIKTEQATRNFDGSAEKLTNKIENNPTKTTHCQNISKNEKISLENPFTNLKKADSIICGEKITQDNLQNININNANCQNYSENEKICQKTSSNEITTKDKQENLNKSIKERNSCHINSEIENKCPTCQKTIYNEKINGASYSSILTKDKQQDLTEERNICQIVAKCSNCSNTAIENMCQLKLIKKTAYNPYSNEDNQPNLNEVACERAGRQINSENENICHLNQEKILENVQNNWICQVCTLKNITSSKNCSVCNSQNPKYITESSEALKNWTCETCTFENVSDCIKCVMCETVKKNKEENNFWICRTCTLKNDEKETECTACGKKRFNDNIQPDDNIARLEWICITCRIKNDENNEECIACGDKRLDINALVDNAEPQNINGNKINALDWICHMCTLKNDKKNERCTACDHKNIETILQSLNDNVEPAKNATKNDAEILEWYCPSCSFKNKQNDKQCRSCKSNITEIFQKLNINATPPERKVKIEWLCACKSINDINNDNCNTCGIDRTKIIHKEAPAIDTNLIQNNDGNVEDKWRCKICTFLNLATVSQCKTCKTNKDEEKTDINPEKSWKCHVCTLINSKKNKNCSACETEKIVLEENNNSENILDGWLCCVCSLKNPNDAPMCSACQTSRSVEMPIPNLEPSEDTWNCPACTFVNHKDELECLLCGQYGRFKVIDVPFDEAAKQIEKKKEKDVKAYLELVEASNAIIALNTENFYCIICMTDCQPGDGIILSECLHQFCRECLKATVSNNEEQGVQILCPYVDDTYRCPAVLTERELRHIVDENTYEKHLAAGLREAKATITGDNNDQVYQCRTADCDGWCIYEDGVTNFFCQVCFNDNCLNCQAIHEDETCAVYQDRIQTEARTNEESRKTHEALQNLLKNGEAMNCPRCGIIIAKRSGCDWLVCSSCRTEICWATRGPRWGPKGNGDTSGGCGCRMRQGGRLCHPNCGNCH